MSRWDWEERLTVGCVESYPWGRVGRNQANTSFPGIQAAYNDRSSAYRAGFRFNIIVGPIQIQVPEEYVEAARALLAQVPESGEGDA